MADGEVWPVAGYVFEDILDGYFTLEESVRQMMQRHDFESIWVTLVHAPVMNIVDLSPAAPVPLSVPKIDSGMIEQMLLSARHAVNTLEFGGVGEWFWGDGIARTAAFSMATRLGEPAFIRGVGIVRSSGKANFVRKRATVALARLNASVPVLEGLATATARLGWAASRAWGLGKLSAEVEHAHVFHSPRAVLGDAVHASYRSARMDSGPGEPPADASDYVLVDLSPNQPDKNALHLAGKL